MRLLTVTNGVSIHAPHEGERPVFFALCRCKMLCFNPRSPRGGATCPYRAGHKGGKGFNPRSPRGGATGLRKSTQNLSSRFQSTLPTRGSDRGENVKAMQAALFQSTLPTRGSDPQGAKLILRSGQVSIHAPHEGERLNLTSAEGRLYAVSIHAPHEGERPVLLPAASAGAGFQSTLPTRGSDFSARCLTWYPRLFQSTLPTRGSDEQYIYATADGITVSIHAPHEGERRFECIGSNFFISFNPRSPRGGATSVAAPLKRLSL